MRLRLIKGWWYVVFRDGRGKPKRVSLRTQNKDEADRQLANFQRGPSGETVKEIFAVYQADKANSGASERIEMAWKALAPHFGQYRPDQVDRARCRAYTERRITQGKRPGTIRKELGTLRAALRYNNKNTPAIIEMPEDSKPREVWLTKPEFNKLHEAVKSTHVKLFLTLARHTAARKEAILSLEWDQIDINPENPQINFGANVGNKGRAIVPINGTLMIALEEARKGRTTDYVIEYGGDRVKSIRKGFDTAKVKAGLPHITPHDVRRSAARWMVERGVSMEEVSQYLGHSTTEVTRRVYARFSPGYLAKAAEALEDDDED